MTYEEIFKNCQPDYKPEHIEKMVRLSHPTLNHLTVAELEAEAAECALAIDELGTDFVEAMA